MRRAWRQLRRVRSDMVVKLAAEHEKLRSAMKKTLTDVQFAQWDQRFEAMRSRMMPDGPPPRDFHHHGGPGEEMNGADGHGPARCTTVPVGPTLAGALPSSLPMDTDLPAHAVISGARTMARPPGLATGRMNWAREGNPPSTPGNPDSQPAGSVK